MFRNYVYDARNARHSFEIHNVDLSIVNGLRRVILTDIPMVGFRGEGEPTIRILKNNGPLHNEFMTHRIGMIPICLTEEEVEGFYENKYLFSLDVTNRDSKLLNVTTWDITGTVREREPTDPTEPTEPIDAAEPAAPEKFIERKATQEELRRWFPANRLTKEPILITRLRPGESLSFEAWPVKSTAREHAAFSPVSLCTHSYMMDEVAVAEGNITHVLQKERTFIKNKYGDPIAFKFDLECETDLSPKYIFKRAMDILVERIDRIVNELSNEPSEIVRRDWCDKVPGYEFTVEKEDDTVGHLLQSTMFDAHVRKEEPLNGRTLTYCGYICPHPLDLKMVFRMVLKADTDTEADAETVTDADTYVSAFLQHCGAVKETLANLQTEWQAFADASIRA